MSWRGPASGSERRRRGRRGRRGQSLVEFVLSAMVLFLILVGLLDLGRAFYFSVALQAAAREGARQAAWFDDEAGTNPFLCDSNGAFDPAQPVSADNPECVKQVVDSVLEKAGLPQSVLMNTSGGCPAAVGNADFNPPYADPAYSGAGPGEPMLYVCYGLDPDLDYRSAPPSDTSMRGRDVNVILLFNYGLVAGFPQLPATVPIAANTHMSVGGY